MLVLNLKSVTLFFDRPPSTVSSHSIVINRYDLLNNDEEPIETIDAPTIFVEWNEEKKVALSKLKLARGELIKFKHAEDLSAVLKESAP